MKKYIEIGNDTLQAIENGKRVEGVLFKDKDTGKITYKAYHRHGRVKRKDVLLYRMEHGWVKESAERIKLYESVPKNLGTVRVMGVMDRELTEARDELIAEELDSILFC